MNTVLFVKRIGVDFYYYICEGAKKVEFILTQQKHDELKLAQAVAERLPQKLESSPAQIEIQIVSAQK